MVKGYQATITALEATLAFMRGREESLNLKVKNLQTVTINLKGILNHIREEANQVFMALAKMLILYDNFSTLEIKNKLLALVSD